MRPLRLEVEGFTCFRDRQSPLELSELSLFAIAGPTGAGKSSILDTMLYALYGQVPRLGKQGIGDAISLNRDELSVCLDFEVRKARYRVVRRAKKRGKGSSAQTTASLVELSAAGVEKPLVDGVRPVNDELKKLLGLEYDQFIQTVILPQGEFARFLRAEPKGQREILQHLLRHGVFERMRAAAEERRRSQLFEQGGLDGQLKMSEHATADALAACEKKLAEARTRLGQARQAKDDADRRYQESRRRRELTMEAERLRAERETFNKKAPEIERAKRELEASHRAAEVQPRLDALQDASGRVTRASTAHDTASRASASAKKTRDAAVEALAKAQAAAQDLDSLTQRLRRLDGIASDLTARRELDAALLKMPAQVENAAAELDSARGAEVAARKTTQKLEAQLERVRQAFDASQFDEAVYAGLDAVRGDVVNARALLRERDEATAEVRTRIVAHDEAQRERAAADAVCDAARKGKDAAARTAQIAATALEDGRSRHRAAALRAHLHAGDECPVCLQMVAIAPPADVPPELATLEAAADDANRHAAAMDRAYQEAALTAAKAGTHETDAGSARNAATVKSDKATAAFAAAFAPLATLANLALPAKVIEGQAADAPQDEARVLASIEERRAALHAMKIERDRQDADVRKVQESLANARLALAKAAAAAVQKKERHDGVLREHSWLTSDLASVVARIEAVTTHPDPSKERDETEARIAQLQTQVRKASDSLTQADIDLAAAGAQLKAAAATHDEEREHVGRMQDQVREALAHTGFSSAADAAAAVRDPARKQALDQTVSAFEQKRAAVLERLGDLEREIAGHEVSAAALAEAEATYRQRETEWHEADQVAVRLEDEHVRLGLEVQRRTELLEQRRVLETSLSIVAELATDLKGDRFQEYLLEEAFKTLVAGASVRMQAISNRYTLGWENGEFYVIDHDNASERRRAETLSGGETFMASLCLALQLGEEVLRTSGALQMDSLFIDEGFGTLDSDSLSEVTDAIESLRQDGGRLIGVISHRHELTDRLPGCIRVDKGVGDSRWFVERVG
jgi:DNA repair protein SbcC/Rad50